MSKIAEQLSLTDIPAPPQFAPLPAAPGTGKVRKLWQAFVAGNGDFK